jgi:HK97 family phage major capsid protein
MQKPHEIFSQGALSRVSFVRPRWQDDPRRGFRGLGDFANTIYESVLGMRADERLIRMEAAGMVFSTGTDGGWLLPPEFSQEVNNVMSGDPMNLMTFCDTYTITGESLTLLANGETSRATGSRWGGIQGYWVEDGTQITASNPKMRRLRLEPRPLHVMVPVDNTLLRNPQAAERLLNQAAPEEIVFLVNDAIINGTGAGKPLGILTSSGRVTVTAESGQGAGTFVKANADKMFARLHSRSRLNARWLHNVDVEPQFEAMVAAGTTPAIPVFLPILGGSPSMVPASNTYLKGKPMLEVEQCATVGTEGDVILCDLGAYALGVRGGIDTAMSMHLYFDRNQSAFRFSFYVDGQPWVNTPLTPFKGSNTQSPFVTLNSTRT